MTPDPELLGDEPVRLGRRRDRDERDQREVLDAEPRPLWHPPRWLVVAVLLVALVGTAAWHLDRQDRAREARALEVCKSRLHNAVVFANLRLLETADSLDPALASAEGARRGHIADLMARPAHRVLGDVRRADRVCRSVSVRPWHFSLVDERRSATAYSTALTERVRAVASRGRAYYRDDSALQRLRSAADIGVIGGPL